MKAWPEMKLQIFQSLNASPSDFVEFWSRQWTDHDSEADSNYYNRHIDKPLTDARLQGLFRWKNQMPLSKGKKNTLKRIIARREELVSLSPKTLPSDFLDRFREGKAIWWIFLLHCWSHGHGSKKYPIYDQHVHRAMSFVSNGEPEESGHWNDKKKVDAYLNRYVEFFDRFNPIEPKKVDQALMVFGRFIKAYRF